MNQLMMKIKDRLESKVYSIRGRDIFLTPDHSLIPKNVKSRCIGLKDGEVTRTDRMAGCTDLTLPVEISVYREFYFQGDEIAGLMDDCQSVVAALKGYFFDGYVTEVSVGDETPVQWMVDRDVMIIRKTIFFEYFKEE